MREREDPAGVVRKRSPLWAVVAYQFIVLLSVFSLVSNYVTLANNDYSTAALGAVTMGGLALLLVFLVWRRVPLPARMLPTPCALADLWVPVDAGGRILGR